MGSLLKERNSPKNTVQTIDSSNPSEIAQILHSPCKKQELTFSVDPQTWVKYQTGRQNEHLGVPGYAMPSPRAGRVHVQTGRYHKDFSDKKQDMISMHIRANSYKLAPNAYSPRTAEDFTVNPNKIHFAISQAPKISELEEFAKRRAFIPGSDVYKHEEYRDRILNGEVT